MALQKSFELQSGHSADYWKVTSIIIARHASELVTCTVSLYKDAAARQAGKDPSFQKQYTFEFVEDDYADTDIRVAVYTKLKELDDFSDAIDV